MQKLTTVIKRDWLRQIVTGDKTIEYRDITPYWESRIGPLTVPFTLRLINGMVARAPEVTVTVMKVVRNTRRGRFGLHIGKVLKNWNRRTEEPSRSRST